MADEQKIQLPAMLDVVQPNGAKICPIMGPQIIQMPINQGSVLAPGQGHTVAYVRQFAPCVKEGCMLWVSEEVGAAGRKIPGRCSMARS